MWTRGPCNVPGQAVGKEQQTHYKAQHRDPPHTVGTRSMSRLPLERLRSEHTTQSGRPEHSFNQWRSVSLRGVPTSAEGLPPLFFFYH